MSSRSRAQQPSNAVIAVMRRLTPLTLPGWNVLLRARIHQPLQRWEGSLPIECLGEGLPDFLLGNILPGGSNILQVRRCKEFVYDELGRGATGAAEFDRPDRREN